LFSFPSDPLSGNCGCTTCGRVGFLRIGMHLHHGYCSKFRVEIATTTNVAQSSNLSSVILARLPSGEVLRRASFSFGIDGHVGIEILNKVLSSPVRNSAKYAEDGWRGVISWTTVGIVL